MIADSLVGAWIGAAWAVRMRTTLLYRVIAVLLVAIAAIRAAEHTGTINQWHLDPTARVIAGIICGAGIGVVAAVMGFAGGELLIPATGSITGTLIGGLQFGAVPAAVLIPLLCTLLIASAYKVWGHARHP